MEDFIYLIILVAWAVFAFYRQSQKKKAAAKAAQDPPPAKPVIEEKQRSWEDILFGEEVPEEHVLEAEQEEVQPQWQRTAEYQPVSLEQMYMQRKAESLEDPSVQERMEKEKPILLEEDEAKEKGIGKQHPLLKDFDLRKAVIYSEILRRPYD